MSGVSYDGTGQTNKRMGGRLDGRHDLSDFKVPVERKEGRKEGAYLPNDDGGIMQQKQNLGAAPHIERKKKSAMRPAYLFIPTPQILRERKEGISACLTASCSCLP